MKFLNNTASSVASNTFYQILGKVITMSVTILVTYLITRYYGRQGYGEFNIMQAFPGLFFIIVDFGINAVATRELLLNWGSARKYLGNVILLRLLMSLFLIFVAYISLSLFPYSDALKFGIYLSLFLILTQALFASTNIIFQVKMRYDLSTIGLICGSFSILVLVLIQTYLKFPIAWVNFSYVIGGVVAVLVNLYFIKKLNLDLTLSLDRKLWSYLFARSWPIGLTFVFSQINFKADEILLSVLKLPESVGLNNTESVGVYGLPYKVFEVSLVFPTFFMNSMYPVYIKHMKEGSEKLKNTFFKSIFTLLTLGISFGLIGIILSPFVINVLGGAEFEQSILVLRLLFIGVFVFYLSQPLTWLIVTLNKQHYLPGIYLFAAILNLMANLYFIPIYSFYASSIITWASELIILFLLILAAKKAWKLNYA